MRESKAVSAQYPWGFKTCGAKAFDPCRSKFWPGDRYTFGAPQAAE